MFRTLEPDNEGTCGVIARQTLDGLYLSPLVEERRTRVSGMAIRL